MMSPCPALPDNTCTPRDLEIREGVGWTGPPLRLWGGRDLRRDSGLSGDWPAPRGADTASFFSGEDFSTTGLLGFCPWLKSFLRPLKLVLGVCQCPGIKGPQIMVVNKLEHSKLESICLIIRKPFEDCSVSVTTGLGQPSLPHVSLLALAFPTPARLPSSY